MEILKRLEQQANVIRELGEELRRESSYRGVERLVQLILQALLDLGLMVLSAIGASPSGYRDVANSLGRLGLLVEKDAELMRAMAGLRNVLVHAYVSTNREIVIESARKVPGDAVRLSNELLSSARRAISDPPEPVEDLADKLREALKGRVKLAFVFGSKAKGYDLKGDVDVALYLGRPPDPYEVGGLVSDIQESLGREDVDILVLDSCDSVALAYEAVQGKPIMGDDIEILQLKTKIASQYLDYIEKLGMIKSKKY
ncbi:MAG: DUF86 domain-containing protein [Candidatus Brockarchaeota archaeon]|nr:DUF86 domain-containing protein [Candidatus Brockarchaeota archaeon]